MESVTSAGALGTVISRGPRGEDTIARYDDYFMLTEEEFEVETWDGNRKMTLPKGSWLFRARSHKPGILQLWWAVSLNSYSAYYETNLVLIPEDCYTKCQGTQY